MLVNDSPTNEFKCFYLRQGDPLTLFLFQGVVEDLSGLMRESKEKDFFKGYKSIFVEEPILGCWITFYRSHNVS